ncbi:MAG TPA: DUF899 family protein [Dongiaceae bacterium]|nr:DUF899 family protein [Dongiaceae bacterium]
MTADTLNPTDLTHGLNYPNESPEYRAARKALLREEIDLRRHLERVAAQRRALPLGGEVKDYQFMSATGPVRLSEVFEKGKNSLITYNWMFGPERKDSCASCAAFLDGLDGAIPHVSQRVNFAVIARSPIERMLEYKKSRAWRNFRMLSSGDNTFNSDYFALAPDGVENPMTNVFQLRGGGVRHVWASEMFYAPSDPGQHPRHNGTLDVLWNLFDLTPDGRGTDWTPQLTYR